MPSDYTPATFAAQPTVTQLNAELQRIKVALDAALQRDPSGPGNELEADLDMNSHRILNVLPGEDPGDVVTKAQLDNLAVGAGATADQAQAIEDNAAAIEDINSNNATQTELNTVAATLQTQITALENTPTSNTDIALAFPFFGTPPDTTELASVIAVFGYEVKDANFNLAVAKTAPSGGNAIFNLQKGNTTFGTVTFADGNPVGVVSINTDTSFAPGEIIVVDSVQMFGIENPTFTLTGEKI